uniref:Galectin n=1 Tax=Phocoena sinus TaxID=42100 RepID=A0A8C9KZ02_PHOSS
MAFVPAPGYQPTYNPTLPYHRPIPGSLRVGMSIYIQGVASEHMKRFFVNFEVGQGPEADVAFHFNPRFDGWDKVVLNTRHNGNWGKEEKKRSMPFSKGAAFELVFMVLAEHYKVVVNGDPFYEFGHRIPLQMVTHLHVDGDLQLQSINFIGGQPAPNQIPMPNPTYPGPGQCCQEPSNLPSMEGPPTFNPPVPFNGRLQGGLTARRTIIVKGYVPPTAKSFVINFKVGSSGDLALHINPRLNEGSVVRNSFLNGSWGAEERKVSYNPFGPGQFFDVSLGSLSLLPSKASVLALASCPPLSLQLSIRCGMDRFKVYANGQHLFDFSHRLSAFQRVDMVEIQGDVTLSYVQI